MEKFEQKDSYKRANLRYTEFTLRDRRPKLRRAKNITSINFGHKHWALLGRIWQLVA